MGEVTDEGGVAAKQHGGGVADAGVGAEPAGEGVLPGDGPAEAAVVEGVIGGELVKAVVMQRTGGAGGGEFAGGEGEGNTLAGEGFDDTGGVSGEKDVIASGRIGWPGDGGGTAPGEGAGLREKARGDGLGGGGGVMAEDHAEVGLSVVERSKAEVTFREKAHVDGGGGEGAGEGGLPGDAGAAAAGAGESGLVGEPGVATIGPDQDGGLVETVGGDEDIAGAEFPRDAGGDDVGAGGAGLGKEPIIQDFPGDGAFAGGGGIDGDGDGVGEIGGELKVVDGEVGEGGEGISEAVALPDGPGARVEAIAADFGAGKGSFIEQKDIEAGAGEDEGGEAAGGTGTEDDDVVLAGHGFKMGPGEAGVKWGETEGEDQMPQALRSGGEKAWGRISQ